MPALQQLAIHVKFRVCRLQNLETSRNAQSEKRVWRSKKKDNKRPIQSVLLDSVAMCEHMSCLEADRSLASELRSHQSHHRNVERRKQTCESWSANSWTTKRLARLRHDLLNPARSNSAQHRLKKKLIILLYAHKFSATLSGKLGFTFQHLWHLTN